MMSLKNIAVRSIVPAVLGVCFFISCKTEEPEKKSVAISPSSVEVPGQGGSVTVNVTSNASWTISSSEGWISFSPSSGNGNGAVTLIAKANSADGDRTCSVTVSTQGATASVSVKQPYYNKYSDISAVRAMYKGSDVMIKDEIWIKGTVVSNFRHTDNGGLNNNTSQKSLVIQDSSAGIQIFCSENNKDFAFGDIVEVSLKGQTLTSYSSLIQFNGVPLANISKIGSETPSPKSISAAELCTGKYESQYVAVADVQVVSSDLGKTFATSSSHTSIGMESKDGVNFLLFSSKYSSFKDKIVPEGSGTLKGIACIFGENYQILLARADDADGLTGARFSNGGEFALGSESASVDGFADTLSINLIANVEWSAASSDPDFKISPDHGNSPDVEPQTIKVSYGRNPSTASYRSVTITFKTTSASVKKQTLEFKIVQDPYQEVKSDNVESWLELPKVEPQEGFVYLNHSYQYYGKTYRNFSLWYDCKNRYSQWAAYPLYSTSTSVSRTDEWDYDPKLPKRCQPELYKAFGVSNVGRGHQVPSGDRLHCKEANVQTFYFTNLTAQDGDFNTGVWSSLESMVRDWAGGCDTLYVVTGALAQSSSKKEITYYSDNIGRPVAVPQLYFKVMLRYRKGVAVNGGYDAIGFIYENRKYSYTKPVSDDVKTIDKMEEITGFDFFHNLPDDIEKAVEATAIKADWGF